MDDVHLAGEQDWESLWAPYDPPTYQAVLKQLTPADIVLEIGAGDLRLAREMAKIAKRVYAIEIKAELLEAGIQKQVPPLPKNLFPIAGDALNLPFPKRLTTAVLLMRHCTHFSIYASKLKAAGCQRLITNARWRLGIETVNLQDTRSSFENIELGWYACWCGAAGFIPGPVEKITPELVATVNEVIDCPSCRNSRSMEQ